MFPWSSCQEAPPAWDRFEVVELARGLDRPLELAVAPDGRVFFVELGGRLGVWRPDTRDVVEAARLEVFADQENGLLGLALDPDFAANHWLYLLHSPQDFSGQHLSRFTVVGDRLDLASQKVLLAFEEQRLECCHHAGSLAFGPDGCLFVATGDNTHPHGDSEGYAPLDERDGRLPWDGRRGAANINSLTGKILRVRPTADGGLELPSGNLFPADSSAGRPEIYCMGCRNPWRISVDARTGFVYWGEVGPDAGGDGPRGPKGYDELNQARGPGNFGWPLFIADNKPYAAYDYTTKTVGARFDPAHPLNDSRYNTGARELPPAQPAWIWYPYDASPEFPMLDAPGGRTACAGPVYHFDPALASPTKFPAAFDGRLFVYEWSRHWIKTVRMDARGDVADIGAFLPDERFVRPVDMQFGPEGSLYLLEYGTTWGTNADARLVRIDYQAGNRHPVAHIAQQSAIGRANVRVALDHAGSFDPDGDALTFRWRAVWPDGHADDLGDTPEGESLLIGAEGVYSIELEVTDPSGASARASLPVLVGNSPPELAFDYPREGGFFDPAQPLHFHVELRDLEDDADDSPAGVEAELARAFVSARFVEGPPDAPSAADPSGLAAMKRGDCFNCHAREHRIVGPSLLEIAARTRAAPDAAAALTTAAEHVRTGSSGVWGSPAMLPHPQHTDEQLRAMVAWIFALTPEDDAPSLVPGLGGELPPPAADGKPKSGCWLLEARYTDAGAGPIGPLTAEARVHVRTLTVEAEHASARSGTQLMDSHSASGGRFVGAIDHGNTLRFAEVDLDGIASVVCRVSSAGAGATVEFRSDAADGALFGSFAMVPNGAWEDWFEVDVPLHAPAGLHDLFVVFRNAASPSGLMNLDALRCVPAGR